MKSTPQVNEVWLARSTGSYFRIDQLLDNDRALVRRLGHVENIGQLDEKNYISRKELDVNGYVWSLSTFKLKDFRRIARKAKMFETWLNKHAVNA